MADYVIIVAGGKGMRMGSEVPKQFLPLGGKPVLMRTIERFYLCAPMIRIILVLPREQLAYWQKLCQAHGFSIPVKIADGGMTRFLSVSNGLQLIDDGEVGVVGVHDGVRPFPAPDMIARCYDTARRKGTAVPVMPVVETLREMTDGGSRTVERWRFRSVQTPQVFDIGLLKRAYQQEESSVFTDDASVVEHLGHDIVLVEGNRENIKITTPFDLQIASLLI